MEFYRVQEVTDMQTHALLLQNNCCLEESHVEGNWREGHQTWTSHCLSEIQT